MFSKPTVDALKHDFVLITAGEPERLTYSIIGYDENRSAHWFPRQATTTTTDGASVLKQLATQYEVAIFLFSRRSWFKKYCQFKFVDTNSVFDPDEAIQHLPTHIRHECVLQILNQCFNSYARLQEINKQYWTAKNIFVPVPVLEYALRVPFEEKDEAKQCGAIWSKSLHNNHPFNHWLIHFKYVSDIRPLLKWANPEDRQFLLNVWKRKKEFEARYGIPLKEAETQFQSERDAAIQLLFAKLS